MRNLNKYDFYFDKAIHNWDEAMALGNAKLGSLVYGDGPLKISVDRVDLWDNRPDEYTLSQEFNWNNLVKLSKSKNPEDWDLKRYRLFELPSRRVPYPTKLTAGRLELDFGVQTQNVNSHLSLQTAIGTVLIDNGISGKLEIFLSATKFIGVVKVWGNYRMNLHIPSYFSEETPNNSSINPMLLDSSLHYPKAQIFEDGEYTFYQQTTHTDYAFGIVTLTKNYGEYKEIYYTVATTDDTNDYIEYAKKKLAHCAKIGYETLKAEHIAWWKDYWNKSEISIGDKLLEKTYYRSYYLFASASREGMPPMALQAVWTADNDSIPPWNGDYHHDANTQLSYQSYLKANRLQEGRAFADYMWNMRDTFRTFAKRFYKVKGLIIPGTMSLDGKAIAGWAQYTLSPTLSIWVAQTFDEYWLYTGDKKYLRTRAFPFFKEIGEAIYSLLEEKDGKLYLTLSSSPEIFNNERCAYLEPNSNFDLALLIYLYKTLENYAKILGKDSTIYSNILAKLDDIAIDKDGVVLLDKTQRLPFSHRHFSHLMCMYPLHLLNYDTEQHKNIYHQTIWNIEQLGEGWWVGFSFGMCAQLYAMMYNGNAAYEKLRTFARGFVGDNGFHLNGDFKWYGFSRYHYRPFTMESIFCYCDALQEMLLQEHQGYIHLFPAIPDDWKEKVSFKRLRSYQGVLVSATLKNGKITKVILESKRQIRVKLYNSLGGEVLVIKHSKTSKEIIASQGENFSLNLHRGKTVICLKS